ncbi:MAG TPA: cytochrome c [Acidobacteriaceae bacterium]
MHLRQGAGLCAAAVMLLIAGCRQDMHDEPKFFPQRGTTLYPDGRSVRPQVTHTVARGQENLSDFYHTGLQNGQEIDALPFPVSMSVLERGQEQFNTYCSPCHSRVGNGAGMIVERGYRPASNFHDAKRMAEPLSHYFYVISHGYGAMPDYAAQVPTADRWAIAAYIRALQLSDNARQSDVPAGIAVQQLGEVAQQQGLPASFAQPWKMPDSAVYPTPPGPDAPGMAPAENITTPVTSRHPAYQLENGDSFNTPNPPTNPSAYKGMQPGVVPPPASGVK